MGTSDRRPYLTATAIDQDFLDACADNLTNQLELICDIEAPDGSIIHASDRNKYVGQTFYEALLNFPTIKRTLGEWLSPEIEFSTMEISLSNADSRFNKYLPGGADYASWIGKHISVKLGLRDVDASYTEIFSGYVTSVGGAKRSVVAINLVARNRWDKLNDTFPTVAFTKDSFPNLENDKEGQLIPFVLGDWTTEMVNLAAIPGIVVNGADTNVYGGSRNNIQCRISINALDSFDVNNVYLKRGTDLYKVPSSDITNISPDKNSFEVEQNTGNLIINETNYVFSTGDLFYCRVLGPSLSGYRDNVLAQAQYILETYSGLTNLDFDLNWEDYKNKSSPAQSAITNIKTRIWIQEPQKVIAYVLSLLEQVRLEAFISRDAQVKINSMHFEDWDSAPSPMIKNWDVERGSFTLAIDDKNNFNRAQASFGYEQVVNENARKTKVFRATEAFNQVGFGIYREIVFPNLYIQSDVENQIKEILKLAAGYAEIITCKLTWRMLLLELGQFVRVNVQIGSSQFQNVPAMVREIGYNPAGITLETTLLSTQMLPFPGWNPGYAGIVGGYSATINEE